jgi:hypothetical protein
LGKEKYLLQVVPCGAGLAPRSSSSIHNDRQAAANQLLYAMEKFFANIDLQDPHLMDHLSHLKHHYNWERVHGAIGMAPLDRFLELKDKTLYWDKV